MFVDELQKVSLSFGELLVIPSDTVGQALIRDGVWDSHLKPAFDAILPGTTVIDVGANFGYFSLYAAYRGCNVIAFEPGEANFKVLVQNIKLNKLETKIKPYQIALYDSETPMEFCPIASNQYSGFAVRPITTGICVCSSRTLDSFGFDNVSLIKVDAQGCDLHILKGSRNTIQRCKPILCYEIEIQLCVPVFHETSTDYDLFIDEIGYRFERVFWDRSFDFVARPKENI